MSKCVLATNQVYSLVGALLSRRKSSFKFGCEPEANIYNIYCSAASSSVVHCMDKLRSAVCVCVLKCQKCIFVLLRLLIYAVCACVCICVDKY